MESQPEIKPFMPKLGEKNIEFSKEQSGEIQRVAGSIEALIYKFHDKAGGEKGPEARSLKNELEKAAGKIGLGKETILSEAMKSVAPPIPEEVRKILENLLI